MNYREAVIALFERLRLEEQRQPKASDPRRGYTAAALFVVTSKADGKEHKTYVIAKNPEDCLNIHLQEWGFDEDDETKISDSLLIKKLRNQSSVMFFGFDSDHPEPRVVTDEEAKLWDLRMIEALLDQAGDNRDSIVEALA